MWILINYLITGIAAVVGTTPRSQYLQKRRQLFQVSALQTFIYI